MGINKLNSILFKSSRSYSFLFAILVICFLSALQNTVVAQNTVSASECSCLGNASVGADDGQFEETITIRSATGRTWRVKQVLGLYKLSSAAPPAFPSQIDINTIVTETPSGSGIYIIKAKRRNNTAWSIIFNDGTSDRAISSRLKCSYPARKLIGDLGVCIGKIKTYRINAPFSTLTSIVWSVPSGGTIIGATNNPTVTVQWGNVVNNYNINVSGQSRVVGNPAASACGFSISNSVRIMNETDPISLACNNSLNITLDGQCEIEITPDMILKNMTLPESSYDVRLRDRERDTFLTTNMVSGAYIGKTLEVSIFHECSGNSCWGTVLIEDKSIPLLNCKARDTIECTQVDNPEITGLPIPFYAFYIKTGLRTFKIMDFDLCSDVTLTYTDSLITSHCTGGISSEFKRTWTATDAVGNFTKCSQLIAVRLALSSALTFPPNYDDILGPNPSLDACGSWIKLPNGHPSPESTGRPTGALCQNLNISFEDIRFDICVNDKTFKIRRKWLVIDVCANTRREETQTITVMDKTAPVCIPPPNFTVSASEKSCVNFINVPIPNVTDCIGWDYTVAIKPVDGSGDPYTGSVTTGIIKVENKRYIVNEVPGSFTSYWISYYIFDGCGNTSQCFTTVMIKDDKPPIAVCKQFTFVALNDAGMAWAGVETFDNGSYDNCAIDRIELKRMTNFACGDSTRWTNKIQFCCEDLGKTIMVQMRVWDKSGNSNTCMVETTVQDNIPPKFVSCPPNITVGCDTNLANLSIYGTPVVIDPCGFKLKDSIVRNLSDCGTGTISRIFIATDSAGNKSSCTQVITVRPTIPFGLADIIWPVDYTITNGCKATEIKPLELPENARNPKFLPKACSRPGYDYKDIIFQYAEGACYKILREWTVIDWCQFDPRNPYGVSWTHTQVIKVLNNTPPTITAGCNASDLKLEALAGCNVRMRISATATDDCPNSTIFFNYEIDYNNNGSIDVKANGANIDLVTTYGMHKVTWFVRDECGNLSTCSRVFDVRDDKKPTPVCHSQVVTVVMPSSKAITIWAKDFIKEGQDNCTPPSKMRYSFTTDPKDSSKVFTCQDLVSNTSGIKTRIYAIDQAGNYDFCEANLLLQDNSGVCTGTSATQRASVAGKVADAYGRVLKDVQITVNSSQPEFPRSVFTNTRGDYNFDKLNMFQNYEISASKIDKAEEGVSTIDLLKMQRHILSISKFANVPEMVAADVNNDGRINISDLVEVRKIVLGVSTSFLLVPSWKFIALGQLPSVDNFYQAFQTIGLDALSSTLYDQSFIGVKMGDVDGSFLSNANNTNLQPRSPIVINTSNTNLYKGENVAIQLEIDQIGLNGLNINLRTNVDKSKFLKAYIYNESNLILDGKAPSWSEAIFTFEKEQNLKLIWTDPSNKQEKIKIVLEFEIMKDMMVEELLVLNPVKNSEAYILESRELVARNIQLNLLESLKINDQLIVYQNVPNPFKYETDIPFEISNQQEVSLNIYTIDGRLIYQKSNEFKKGLNRFKITEQELSVKGMLYYNINTKTQNSGRRMIKID
jgi:hypothetical protein